jgi:acyl carrier protein
MEINEVIVQAVFEALDEANLELPQGCQLTKSIDATLFGEGGQLDSLGLVRLLVAVEHNIEDTLGVTISIADERAVSEGRSPFRNVGRLVEYILCKVTGEHGE